MDLIVTYGLPVITLSILIFSVSRLYHSNLTHYEIKGYYTAFIEGTKNRHRPDPINYVMPSILSSIPLVIGSMFLGDVLYRHTLATLIGVAATLIIIVILYLAFKLGRNTGHKAVMSQHELEEENKRLQKIIDEELEPIDSSSPKYRGSRYA